jgi:hypothetical protein
MVRVALNLQAVQFLCMKMKYNGYAHELQECTYNAYVIIKEIKTVANLYCQRLCLCKSRKEGEKPILNKNSLNIQSLHFVCYQLA